MGYFYNSSQTGRARTVNISSTVEDQTDTLYTCPANVRAYMSLLFVKNISGGNCTVDIEWDRADGTHAHILGDKNMGNGEFIQFSDGFIVFEPGDALTVTPSSQAAPHIDTFATVEEFFQTQ
jgi:hypothetical protein